MGDMARDTSLIPGKIYRHHRICSENTHSARQIVPDLRQKLHFTFSGSPTGAGDPLSQSPLRQ